MKSGTDKYDLLVAGGRVIDPSQSIDGQLDVAIRAGRIAEIAPAIPRRQAARTVDAENCLVCPGFIDLHVHVYEWVTDFGLPPDDVGIGSGVTTVVDQGSSGPSTFPGFKAYIADRAHTDVRCFLSINLLGALCGGFGRPVIHSPELADVDAIVTLAGEHPELVCGIKCHGESGALSRWGLEVLELAREAADRTGLPLYVHTGELFPVVEASRPEPDSVLFQVLTLLRPGDVLAHCYSDKPDGVMGLRDEVPAELIEAVKSGILLDLGHGINFSFDIAKRMISAGLLPYTISSDVHGDFYSSHNDTTLDYSLYGAASKMLALGMPLARVIAGVTVNPAKILRAENEIGTLRVGSRADISVVRRAVGDWVFHDGQEKTLKTRERLIPVWVVREGEAISPTGRLLRDLGEVKFAAA